MLVVTCFGELVVKNEYCLGKAFVKNDYFILRTYLRPVSGNVFRNAGKVNLENYETRDLHHAFLTFTDRTPAYLCEKYCSLQRLLL